MSSFPFFLSLPLILFSIFQSETAATQIAISTGNNLRDSLSICSAVITFITLLADGGDISTGPVIRDTSAPYADKASTIEYPCLPDE